MLKLGDKVPGQARHRSAKASLEKRAHGEAAARRLLSGGLAAGGLDGTELAGLPGSEARKVAIAPVIWEQTTVSLSWLARELHLRSPANASHQIRRHRRQPPPLPKALQRWVTQSRNVA